MQRTILPVLAARALRLGQDAYPYPYPYADPCAYP